MPNVGFGPAARGGGAQTANANLLTNGSFETPASAGSPSLPNGSTYLTGWTVINAEIAQIFPGAFGITASNGLYSLDLAGYHDAAPYGGVRQVIATVSGAVYNISFDVGSISGTSGVKVLAGSLSNNGFSTSTSLLWTTFSSTFTALGSTTAIDLIGLQPSSSGTYIGLDNVDVTLNRLPPTGVPEPDSLLLFGAGLFALFGVRRRTQAGFKAYPVSST